MILKKRLTFVNCTTFFSPDDDETYVKGSSQILDLER